MNSSKMEDKENSGGSANTSSSDEHFNNRENIKDASAEPSGSAEEVNTEDLNLQLELDESLKETQDEYRMFSRIGSSSVDNRKGCEKDAQEFHLSKSTEEDQSSHVIQESSKTKKDPNEKYEVSEKVHEKSKAKGSMKRLLDSEEDEGVNTKKPRTLQNTSNVSNDEIDMFNTSQIIEDNPSIQSSDQCKKIMLNKDPNEASFSCDKSVDIKNDVLGQSSTSVEELEISCNNVSKHQSWRTEEIRNHPTPGSSIADSSCIILDELSTRESISEIELGDSESQEEEEEEMENEKTNIKQEASIDVHEAMVDEINDSKEKDSTTPSLFTIASNVPIRKIDAVTDSSSSDYSMFKSSNKVSLNENGSKNDSNNKDTNLYAQVKESERGTMFPCNKNKKIVLDNGGEGKLNAGSRLGATTGESESNTVSTGSGNSGVSADDEATHSALLHEEDHRTLSSLSYSSSRPGSSLMYANSPSQTSAWGSDVSPITKPSNVIPSNQTAAQSGSSNLIESKQISSLLSERKYSTPERNSINIRHSMKENAVKSFEHQEEIHRIRRKTLKNDSIETGSTDEEPPPTARDRRKPPTSPTKKGEKREENDKIKASEKAHDTNEIMNSEISTPKEDQSTIQSDTFKTPQSTSSPTTFCTSTDQDCQFVVFKINDLEVLNRKWPEAYKYLVSKGQNLKRLDTQSSIKKDNRRMSDVSSLSSNSRSSSYTGYLGDIGTSSSSGASTASFNSRSKRDRLSIDPESVVGKGRLIAPLPNLKRVHYESIEEEGIPTASICSTAGIMGSQEAVHDVQTEELFKSNSNEEAVYQKDKKLEELIPIKTRGKKKSCKRDVPKQHSNEIEDIESIQSQEIPVQEQIKIDLDGNGTLAASTTKPLMKNGMQVFAKWTQKTDIRYYPGTITNEVDDDEDDKMFFVKFDDGFERGGLRWDDMIPVGMLEMGNAVNVEDDDTEEGIYYPAILSAYPEFVREEEEDSVKEQPSKIDVMYTVDYEKVKLGCTMPQFETERISYKRVFLDKQQALAIKKSLGGYWNPPISSNLGAEMSLDNLMSGKRCRSRLSSAKNEPSTPLSTPQKQKSEKRRTTTPRASRAASSVTPNKSSKNTTSPGTTRASGSKRRAKRGGDCVESSVAEDDEEGVDGTKRKFTRKTSLTSSKNICIFSTTEEENTERSPPRTDRRKRKISKLPSEQVMNAAQTKRFGSKSINNLFVGLHFVLTQGSNSLSKTELGDVADMTSAMETETESEMLDAIPKESSPSDSLTFNRKRLKELITKHGGVVLEDFPGGAYSPFPQPLITQKGGQELPKMIVVSDRYCQTMSFLLAIGFGTVRISHLWVLQSVTEGKLQPMKNYYLPVGWSVIEDREIEQNEFGEKLKDGIFCELHLLISSTNSAFIADWKPLLARLGANVSCRSKGNLDKSLKAIDVVVVDANNVSKTIVQSASNKNITIVNATWIIQSLINGCAVPYENFLLSTSGC